MHLSWVHLVHTRLYPHCNSYATFHQAMCRDSRIVPGAAATEMELAKRLKEFSFKETGYLFNTYFRYSLYVLEFYVSLSICGATAVFF